MIRIGCGVVCTVLTTLSTVLVLMKVEIAVRNISSLTWYFGCLVTYLLLKWH